LSGFFDHAWFIHRGHKPLVVPFSSDFCQNCKPFLFLFHQTFVKIGEGYEGKLSSPMSEYQVVENRLSEYQVVENSLP